MLRKISNYIFSLTLFFFGAVSAQVVEKKDSTQGEFRPTGIRVGVDVISIIKTFAVDDFKGWELQADVDFKDYYLAMDVGGWQRDVNLSNGRYTNAGNYWRVGVDVNFLKKDPIKNMFFFGFRIGHSKYDEALDYTITTKEFGIVNKTVSNKDLKSNWMELTTGLKVKVYKFIWMGYTARIKFLPGLNKDQPFQTYDIPGYGLTFKKPWWGINYYVMFRLPLRKAAG